MWILRTLFVGGLAVFAGRPQAPAKAPRSEFETVSVKVSRPIGRSSVSGVVGGPGSSDPGRVSFPNDTLAELISMAWNTTKDRVVGPSWLDTDRFDIVGTLKPGATREELREMLKAALTERFELSTHMGRQEMHVYEMALRKPGPSLRQSQEGGRTPPAALPLGPARLAKDGFPQVPAGVSGDFTYNDRRRIVEFHRTMDWLARRLARELKTPVVDLTRLQGAYDLDLHWVDSESPDFGPGLQDAVKDQLGLSLTPRKGPVDVVIVDHARRTPTEN